MITWFVLCFYLGIVSSLKQNARPRRLQNPVYWGQWSEWSACSSTCGQGVTTRTRACLVWSLDGNVKSVEVWKCRGRSDWEKICKEQVCDEAAATMGPDCKELGRYRQLYYKSSWKRVTIPAEPCKVHCQKDHPRSVRTVGNISDGTLCTEKEITAGFCEGGVCKPRLKPSSCERDDGRQLQFDMCQRCGGDNSTCYLVHGTRDSVSRTRNMQGDEFIVFMPKGSTSLKISKFGLGRTSLALVSTSNKDILAPPAGQLGRSILRGGNTVWTHDKTLRTESLLASGPVGEDILVLVVGIGSKHRTSYSFWAPKSWSVKSKPVDHRAKQHLKLTVHGRFSSKLKNTNNSDNTPAWILEDYISRHPTVSSSGNSANFNSTLRFDRIPRHSLKTAVPVPGHSSMVLNPRLKSIMSANHFIKNKDDINTENKAHSKKDGYNNYFSSKQRTNSDSKGDIFTTSGNQILGHVGIRKHSSSHKESHKLSSPKKQGSISAGRVDASGMGSGTNGLSKFESQNNLIGEAREESSNNEDWLSVNRRTGRDRTKPNKNNSGASSFKRVLSSSRRRPSDTDAAYPSRQTSEDKKDNIRRSPYGKENKRKKKKKRQKEKKKEKENVLTVSLPKPYDCYPCPRMNIRKKQFCSSDFVSKIYINRRKTIQNETRYDITVFSSYRNRVRLMRREYLWVASRCRCPNLRAKRTYILMGNMEQHKDREARLVVAPGNFVRGFSLGQDRRLQQLAKRVKCPD